MKAASNALLSRPSLLNKSLPKLSSISCCHINTCKYNSFNTIPQTSFTNASRLLAVPKVQTSLMRDLTKYSLRSGKRKTVKAVLKRFYRLEWGMWIRGKCGRQKKLYKKSSNRRRRLKQHVFTNGTQSWLLDKMVTNFWRKPKYYIDDIYAPYHKREEFFLTRKKPKLPDC